MADINSAPIPLWAYVITAIFCGGLTGGTIVGLVSLFLNRKKPNAEIGETDSRKEFNLASARSAEISANATAGEVLLKVIRRVGQLELKVIEYAEEQIHDKATIAHQASEIAAYEGQRMALQAIKLEEESRRLKNG